MEVEKKAQKHLEQKRKTNKWKYKPKKNILF